MRFALLFISGIFVALGLASPANAGDGPVDPNFSVDTDCVEGQGAIIFTLMDGSYPVSYDLSIDGALVGDGVSEGTYTYKPYAAGPHDTRISYTLSSRQLKVDDDTWTVEDCGDAPPPPVVVPETQAPAAAAPSTEAPTTTAAPTTAAPTTATPTTATPTTVASNAAAALPATGRASGNLALVAVLLTAVGGGLLLVVRQARRA